MLLIPPHSLLQPHRCSPYWVQGCVLCLTGNGVVRRLQCIMLKMWRRCRPVSQNAENFARSYNDVFYQGGVFYIRPDRPIDPSRQNVPKKSQRFFTDHTDEVLCLDTHPSGSLVASGQRGYLPKVLKASGFCSKKFASFEFQWFSQSIPAPLPIT